MPSIRVLYSRSFSPFSWLVRLASWGGPWSHCAIIDGGHVIEALGRRNRVVRTPLARAVARATAFEIVEFECPCADEALLWARESEGSMYDWGGLFAILFRDRSWNASSRWFCSEHVEQTLLVGGLNRWRGNPVGISPTMSYYAR